MLNFQRILRSPEALKEIQKVKTNNGRNIRKGKTRHRTRVKSQ